MEIENWRNNTKTIASWDPVLCKHLRDLNCVKKIQSIICHYKSEQSIDLKKYELTAVIFDYTINHKNMSYIQIYSGKAEELEEYCSFIVTHYFVKYLICFDFQNSLSSKISIFIDIMYHIYLTSANHLSVTSRYDEKHPSSIHTLIE